MRHIRTASTILAMQDKMLKEIYLNCKYGGQLLNITDATVYYAYEQGTRRRYKTFSFGVFKDVSEKMFATNLADSFNRDIFALSK